MKVDLNYAKAGITEGWLDLIPVDMDTNCMILAKEINCREGWAISYGAGIGGKHFICERITGRFRLMHRDAAKKLGVKFI